MKKNAVSKKGLEHHRKTEVPDKKKESPRGSWDFMRLMPLFDLPKHDSAETIRRALNLGMSIKMITGGGCEPETMRVRGKRGYSETVYLMLSLQQNDQSSSQMI